MSDDALLKSRILSIVEIVLRKRGDNDSLSLLISKIEKMSFSPDQAHRSILRIRMGIALLISEELSEDIYAELLSQVESVPPPPPTAGTT